MRTQIQAQQGPYRPVWNTAEADAWSRNFSYVDYVMIICVSRKLKPVSEEMYNDLCGAFTAQMERDLAQPKTPLGDVDEVAGEFGE